MATWKIIEDKDIRHIWGCDCGSKYCKEIAILPTFYANNGTPICDCGEDMKYIRTEVKNG